MYKEALQSCTATDITPSLQEDGRSQRARRSVQGVVKGFLRVAASLPDTACTFRREYVNSIPSTSRKRRTKTHDSTKKPVKAVASTNIYESKSYRNAFEDFDAGVHDDLRDGHKTHQRELGAFGDEM